MAGRDLGIVSKTGGTMYRIRVVALTACVAIAFASHVGLSVVTFGGEPPGRRIAAVVTEYRHNSHADMIVSRLLLTDTLDGTGRRIPVELASLYTDQRPQSDISRRLSAVHGFPIESSTEDELTLSSGKLAVDGVFLVAEHGDYPDSATGNRQYPKRRF